MDTKRASIFEIHPYLLYFRYTYLYYAFLIFDFGSSYEFGGGE